MVEEFKFNGPHGWTLNGRCWKSEGSAKTLVGVHGYSEHSGSYSHFAEFLSQHGFDVIWIDLPGHGRSEGRRNNIDDFEDYIEALEGLLVQANRRALPKPFYLFGHSLGGLISSRFIQQSSSVAEFSGLLLSAPFLGICNFSGLKNLIVRPLSHIFPNVTIPNQSNLGPAALTHDIKMQKIRMEDPLIQPCVTMHWLRETYKAQSMLFKSLDQIKIPVGVFQGEDELVVDIDRVKEFYHKLKTKKFYKSYPGMRHEILNEVARQKVMEDMLHWMNSLQEVTASSVEAVGST